MALITSSRILDRALVAGAEKSSVQASYISKSHQSVYVIELRLVESDRPCSNSMAIFGFHVSIDATYTWESCEDMILVCAVERKASCVDSCMYPIASIYLHLAYTNIDVPRDVVTNVTKCAAGRHPFSI